MLWGVDGAEVSSHLALRSLASMALGYRGLALLGSGVTPLYLPTAGEDSAEAGGRRATYAQSLRPFEQNAYAFVAERHAVEETSASLRWMYAAADLGLMAASIGLLAPAVIDLTHETDPCWQARWQLRHSSELRRAIASLEAQVPPALWAPFPGDVPPKAVHDVVEYFADGAAPVSYTHLTLPTTPYV